MIKVAAGLIACSLSFISPTFAQTAIANPTQQPQSVTAPQDRVAVFSLTVVSHSTPAVNYRPRKGDTKIDFQGTALLPRAEGTARVSGEKGYMKIEAEFKKLEPPVKFGREYLTYVLWAITPEGRAANLGEIQYDDDEAKIKVTTELQAFGLIVTAEPYFAVTQPSDAVVMENVLRKGTEGTVDTVQARYDLLKRGTYLMNQDATRLKVKPLEPGAPLDLAEARNAVELARIASAERYSGDSFAKAERLLADAERAHEKHKNGKEVQMPARQAVQTAEDARLVSLQRAEQERLATERAQAEQRERDANERARAEEARRRQLEVEAQAAATLRAAADQQRADAEAARLAAERDKAQADAARATSDAARRDAEAQAQQAQNQAQQAQNLAAQSQKERDELRDSLRQQLNAILETRETVRGLIVNLSDVLFDTGSYTLKPGAREKLSRVSGILSAHPGLKVVVEGHTDSVGSDSYNQLLSEERASSVRDFLVVQGIGREAVATAGFGESRPVASNDTAAGRQQNRRVEMVVSGDVIGRR